MHTQSLLKMPKLTLEEKKRETIRRQLYGREVMVVTDKVTKDDGANELSPAGFKLIDFSVTHTPDQQTVATGNYFRKDLTKTLISSVVAIGAQLALFFAIRQHLVKLPV